MWAGLAPALARRPAGCRPSRPPPPGGRGSLLCLHRVVVSLAHGWGWVGMEGPHLPCLCSSSSLPQTWGPAALDPWASLLSASPILAGPPRGNLGEGGCREPRPGVAGGSGCSWTLCHKDLGAVQRCSESPGGKAGGSGFRGPWGTGPSSRVPLPHPRPYFGARERKGRRVAGGAGSGPRIHRGNEFVSVLVSVGTSPGPLPIPGLAPCFSLSLPAEPSPSPFPGAPGLSPEAWQGSLLFPRLSSIPFLLPNS